MSQAFVKESDGEWLHDIPPTLPALVQYLTRENNNIRVYEKRQYYSDKFQKDFHEMSNGLTYAKDEQGKWSIVD